MPQSIFLLHLFYSPAEVGDAGDTGDGDAEDTGDSGDSDENGDPTSKASNRDNDNNRCALNFFCAASFKRFNWFPDLITSVA